MKKLTLLLLTAFGIVWYTNAQITEWLNYTNGDHIYALAEEGDNIWVCTRGCLV